ncbi:hypothetical protein [Macrococcoides caseolyticum]|uniref:hypothetical protein n=1 Tax=Macrococcoides caseolyticum TaxID=69966 RepID=UPI001F262865|nr:hypothetical protein [Macrococcus caseolyticus]MCE4955934.1 hypothetical protein [Macrococcus caseolyticus]
MIQSVLAQGVGKMNEDAVVINDDAKIYGVIDGVTSLDGKLVDGVTPGKRAAEAVKISFEQADAQKPLNNATEFANASIQTEMNQLGVEINHPKDRFQCCHAVVKLGELQAEYTTSADCVIYTIDKSHLVTQVMPKYQKVVERNNVKMWEDKYPGVYDGGKLPDEMLEAIHKAKATANIPGGYSVMNGDVKFNQSYNRGKIDTTNLSHILLTTDGFFDIESIGLDKFVMKFIEFGLDKMLAYMIDKELEDHDKKKYPRVKLHDDKAAVLITL